MGTGSFAAPALSALAQSDNALVLVIARPDRPSGKHQWIEPGAVRRLAEQLRLPVEQPHDVNQPEFCTRLRRLEPDLLIVADYGQILSAECLDTARLGGLNIHGSLLPRYRGAAPVAWAIYHGDTETGVTVFQMTPRMDAGGIVSRERVPIGPDQTAGELEAELANLGARMIVEAVRAFATVSVSIGPQDDSQASRAPRLKKADGLIVWQRRNDEIHNQVRALFPWPIAYTFWPRADAKLRIQVLRTQRAGETADESETLPGTIEHIGRDELVVRTGRGRLVVHRVKPEGRREMSAAAFARGYAVRVGDRFG
jgi:methionyl-tRNA formyltransferase